jgi:transposase
MRRLATVATADGVVIQRLDNPRPLQAALRELRHASRARSRCVKGSRQYRERTIEISRLHRRVTCSAWHQRDDNAAINLARWEEPATAVGPVGAAVKRRADHKTRSYRRGDETRKGERHPTLEQPRDGVRVA